MHQVFSVFVISYFAIATFFGVMTFLESRAKNDDWLNSLGFAMQAFFVFPYFLTRAFFGATEKVEQ
ncbi:MAG: hypothetical protein CMK09_08920 [Ponticaulis sp.]|mgnify:CR=1 FL=1|nr:hypothetical protein [Ponticaulis sp.]|tara:strand:- start:8102 stop:8299 length:198 start_codon:yes stop_codon:yes gene_type:complete